MDLVLAGLKKSLNQSQSIYVNVILGQFIQNRLTTHLSLDLVVNRIVISIKA